MKDNKQPVGDITSILLPIHLDKKHTNQSQQQKTEQLTGGGPFLDLLVQRGPVALQVRVSGHIIVRHFHGSHGNFLLWRDGLCW